MKTYTTTRYKCDFCNKRSGRKSAMERHERSCTANPNRGCLLCDLTGIESPPIDERFALIRSGGSAADLLKLCDRCPACALASLRQFPDPWGDGGKPAFEFDAKAEFESWWSEFREEQTAEYREIVGAHSVMFDCGPMRYDV